MAKPKPTALYHVGLNPDAPYDVIHLAGFEIPKRSERVEGYGASTKRSVHQGTYLLLTDDQVAAIKKASTEKVFRFGSEVTKKRGGKETKYRRAFIVSKAGSWRRAYEEREDDVVVGAFVYIRRTEHNPIRDESFDPIVPAKGEASESTKPAKKVS